MDFSNLKILVIGDVCLDVIEEGVSTRLSPEAPVPVVLNPTENYSLGMAANVLSNLVNLGADVDFAFMCGSDYYGQIFHNLILELFEGSNKLNYSEHESEYDFNTIVKKRIFSNNQQIARIDYEYQPNESDVTNRLIDYLDDKIKDGKHYDAIIISDYNKGTITEYVWMHIKHLLEQLSDKIFVDTKKLDVLNYFKGMHIFPNTDEIEKLLEFNYLATKNELRVKLNLPFLIQTASEDGAYIYQKDKTIHCKAYKESVIDICGCGDTFISAFVLFYSKFENKTKALDFANYCSSKVILKKGTSTVNINEVLDFAKFWD